MEVYVHNNPSNITFNAYVLVFLRSWNLPWDPKTEEPWEDSWLRVPAFRSPGTEGKDHYLIINNNIEHHSPIVIAEDDCTVLKVGQGKPQKVIPRGMVLSLLDEAIDIPAWELAHQKAWSYKDMFNESLVMERHAAKFGQSTASITPQNKNLNIIRRSIAPRPCRRCGKNRVRHR